MSLSRYARWHHDELLQELNILATDFGGILETNERTVEEWLTMVKALLRRVIDRSFGRLLEG